ncbi:MULTISPECIES: bifunctional 5-amino-6-(5-phosphoribosylamino)uracil reductase/diaminohydroxyphosphoribosylaminopyrimidine deaminase [Bacillus]|nr:MULTISPECIES: bifunctional 5-amino-6-(5-phosphoribosylamino)uracil reductase/diaminohydroxyphosphoribosylaminopyrimidine deaminase [Bacillus]EKF36907.1 bifunctional 5-amino-6-(5-phosphoribosylamino)uracil reductase/diaminohydroxyphosphoribosylaminopyrimidine deaminase [Bacillus xiamenensis]MBG9911631.1 hypothetical protein [Bacillus xiamenensis]MCW1836586.1 hypothetical protein [Bacillus xiamenensis]MCY9577620.1 hypothetical protein [Bacillus xiamenensis]QGX66867.1 hypothetical protein GPA0
MKKVISKLNRNEWSCQEGECVIFRSNTSVQSHDLDVTFIGGEDAPSYFEGEGVEKRKEAIRPVEVEYSMV